jgi:hypothetical protein
MDEHRTVNRAHWDEAVPEGMYDMPMIFSIKARKP